MTENIIPPRGSNRKKKYPFNLLINPGDNIFIKTDKIRSARDAAYKYAKYHKIIVVTREVLGGVRIYHAGYDIEQQTMGA